MKAIMYHYVREYDPTLPYFRFLDINDFKKQLDFFEKNFGFVSKNEWEDFICGNYSNNLKNKIILTFDDERYCHHKYVFPELVKRNLWVYFIYQPDH